MLKRHFTGLLLGAVLALPLAGQAMAQFPDHEIRVVAGFAPGGATDVAARIIANKMSEVLGKQVYIENKPGDSTNIAAVIVRDSAADGYTLFIAGNSNSVNPALRANVPVDILNDFKPIALWATVPNILVATPSLGVTDLAGLIEKAKTTEGGLFFGSSGIGSVSHLSGEYLANQAGIQLTHIPYKGSAEAMNDLLAGQTQLMFAARSTVASHIEDGSLIALASTTKTRPKGLEDLPTVSEAGIPGFDAAIWFGIVAPAATPDDVVATLKNAVDVTLADAGVQEQLAAQGIDTFPGDGAAYWAYMKADMDKWAKLIVDANITVE